MFGNQQGAPVSPPRAGEDMRTERRKEEKKVEPAERGQEVRFT